MNAWKQTFIRALAEADYQAARACLEQLPRHPATAAQAGEILELLRLALQSARIQRAHDAARLTEVTRASAYRPAPQAHPRTWQMDA